MDAIQLTLALDGLPATKPNALLTVDEIYDSATQVLLSDLKEDRRIERKPAGIAPRQMGEYLSMWANTAGGGLIVVGMEDDGTFSGCGKLSQERINELERAAATYCPDAKLQSKPVAVNLPDEAADFILLFRIFYREDKVADTVSGDAFIRVSDQKHKLSQEERREHQIDRRQVDLEQEPSQLAYPRDFDLRLIRQFCSSVREIRALSGRSSDEEILELRHLGKRKPKGFSPNVAFTLLFARDPCSEFPGCKLRFLRFDGEHEGTGDRFNAIKDETIEACVPQLIVRSAEILEAQLRSFSRLGPDGKFYSAPEYPKFAWYEAIVNACCHRSYSLRTMPIFVKMFDDRLVIESPGPLPPLVTPENIYNVHHPRNPHLMDAMFHMNFVKCAHEGTRRIRDTMLSMNLPPPEFEQKQRELGHAVVRVTLRNKIKQRKVWVDSVATGILSESERAELSQHELRAVNFVAENGSINVSQLQRLTGRSWKASKKDLVRLTARRILKPVKREGFDRDPEAHYVFEKKRQH